MGQNLQTPQLFTISSGTLTVTYARSISVLTLGGATDVTNDFNLPQTMSLPDGVTLEMDADSGDTLKPIVITPNGGTAYIVVLSGFCVYAP